jgi:hypothetical protein
MTFKTTHFRSRIAYVTAFLVALLCAVPLSLSLVTVQGIDVLFRHHIVRTEDAAAAVVAHRVRLALLEPGADGTRLMSANLETAAAAMMNVTAQQLCAAASGLTRSSLFSAALAASAFSGGTSHRKNVALPLQFSIVQSPQRAGDEVTWNTLCQMENQTEGSAAALSFVTVVGNASRRSVTVGSSAVFERLLPVSTLDCSVITASAFDNATAKHEWRIHTLCPLPALTLLQQQQQKLPLSFPMLYLHTAAMVRLDESLVQLADPLSVSVAGVISQWRWDGFAILDQDRRQAVVCLDRGAIVVSPSIDSLCGIIAGNSEVMDATTPIGVSSGGYMLSAKPEKYSDVRWVVVTASGSNVFAPIVRVRGIVLVISFCITAVTIFLLIIMLRLLTQPLRGIITSIKALSKMRLDDIGLTEASTVSEIREIQKCVSYLAIRLYHYMRFLPDQTVLAGLTVAEAGEGSESDDETLTVTAPSKGSSSLHVPLLRPTSMGGKRPSSKGSKSRSAVHTITVDALYESRRVGRNTPDRRFLPNKSANFKFSYKVHDPVFTKLVRACREQLHEHPGECLLVFAHTAHGQRQLVCDEDVFCAFELDAAKDPYAGSTIRVTVRKGSNRNFMPLAIAVGTLLSVLSRLVLCIQRLAHPDVNVQFLGLVLLCCIGMQVAQNTLIALYLIRRFAALDVDFRSWLAVAQTEAILSVLCGSLNITNITVMSCHVRLSKNLRLNAPLSNALLEKISKYSLVGFILGDLIPFSFILIDVVLKDKYEDPFVILTTVVSLFSVSSILVQHGLRRFVMDDDIRRSTMRSSATAQNTRRRAQLLSRREVSLVRTAITGEALLLEFLSPPVAEMLCESFYSSVTSLAKRFGGSLVELKGLECAVAFNAQSEMLQHSGTAIEFFLALHETVEVNVLHAFFTGDKFLSFLSNELASAAFNSAISTAGTMPSSVYYSTPPIRLQALFHEHHRLVGSMVVGEMAIGVAGSLTSQTLQHVGLSAVISTSLCRMNEWYGSTLLTNEEAAVALDWANSVLPSFRRIDRLRPGSGLFIPCLTNTAGSNTEGSDVHPPAWEDIEPSSRIPQDPPKIVVYEAVVTSFQSFKPAESSQELLALHKKRCSRPSPATIDAVRRCDDALEMLLSLNNQVTLRRYVESNPADVVAFRVLRWAEFLCASNSREGVMFPRLLTYLGASQHPCEADLSMEPALSSDYDAASAVLKVLVEKQETKERLLRPPRSVRREAQRRSELGDAAADADDGGGARVLQRMLAADSSFHVSFRRFNTADIDLRTI